jgi:hypothetical protein
MTSMVLGDSNTRVPNTKCECTFRVCKHFLNYNDEEEEEEARDANMLIFKSLFAWGILPLE